LSKTVSSRLQDSKHEVLREKCNQLGCSMNDFIKDAIEMKLNGSNSFDGCTEDCDEEIHETYRKIIDNIHEAEFSFDSSEKTGKPIFAEIAWPDNDDEDYFEKKWQKEQNRESKPKITIKDIPELENATVEI